MRNTQLFEDSAEWHLEGHMLSFFSWSFSVNMNIRCGKIARTFQTDKNQKVYTTQVVPEALNGATEEVHLFFYGLLNVTEQMFLLTGF